MTAEDVARGLAEGTIELVDVRTRAEFDGVNGYPCDPRQGHIPGATHLEVDVLMASQNPVETVRERGLDTEKTIVTYCHSGQRSEVAAARLRQAGLDAVNYVGSWHEWSRRPLG